MSDYCYFCGKAGANYSMKRPGYATEEVSIHKGCYLAPKAEGPARNEPEQSTSIPPGSTSGVVDALRPFAEAYQRLVSIPTGVFPILVSGAELAAANQAFIAASLPQAPAQAPDVEGAADTSTMIAPDGDLAEWVFSIKPGSRADAFVSGFNAAVSMLGKYQGPTAPSVAVAWERYKKSLPAPGSQGVEAPRKEAREWLDSCPTCKVAFPKGGYHNCPAVREVREGGTSGEVTEKLRERLIQRIDENNALLAKTESLEAKLRALEGEVETWRRAAVLAVAPLEAMGIAGLVPSFCSDMQRGIAEGVVAVRDACREVEPRPTKGEEGANAP